VTRKVLIVGLILLAAFLPLAAIPVAMFVVDVRVFVVDVAQYVSTNAPSVTLLALIFLRAPPSH
jgi:hypothetical protein